MKEIKFKKQNLQCKSFDLSKGSIFDDSSTGIWSPEEQAKIDLATLKSLFYSEDWVYIIVDLIASSISTVPMRIYSKTIENDAEVIKENPKHPLNALIQNPNKYQDECIFKYNMAVEYSLMGNACLAYFEKLGTLIPMQTESIICEFAGTDLSTYKYNPEGNKAAILTLPADQVLHVRRANPNSMYWGLSPFIPGRKSILFNRYSQDYLNAFYLKGASPQIALSMDRAASTEAVTRMLRSFEQTYLGRKNMRRTLLLPKGVSATTLDVTIADQNLIELIKMNRETVINLLHAPKHAFSLAENGSLGSEEHKQALKYFFTATIQPIMNNIAGTFTRFFQKQLGDNFFKFDTSEVALLKEDASAKADLGTKMLTTHTVNEVRKELYDLEPIVGGDVIVSLIPKPAYPGQQQFALPVEAVETKSVDELSFISKVKAANKDWIDETEARVASYEEKTTPAIKVVAYDYFIAQAEIVGEILQENFKSFDDDINNADTSGTIADKRNTVKLAKLRRQISDAFAELPNQYVAQYEHELKDGVSLGNSNILSLFTGKPDYEAIQAINERNEAGRRKVLADRGLFTFEAMNKTTTESVMNTVATGMQEKKTLRQIAADIFQNFKNVSPSRAQTIARTEILTAISIGNYAATKDAARVVKDLVKIWMNAGDNRVRGNPGGLYPDSPTDHWHLEGEKVPVNEPFSNGLMFPRDPNGDAASVINCRCSLITISARDANLIG